MKDRETSTKSGKNFNGGQHTEAQIEAAYGKLTESSIKNSRKTLNYKDLRIDFIMLSDKVAQFTIRIPARM